jgi:hypothetical protein
MCASQHFAQFCLCQANNLSLFGQRISQSVSVKYSIDVFQKDALAFPLIELKMVMAEISMMTKASWFSHNSVAELHYIQYGKCSRNGGGVHRPREVRDFRSQGQAELLFIAATTNRPVRTSFWELEPK